MPGILLIFPRGRGRAYPNLTSPDTNFRSNSGWVVDPLWFLNSSASIRSAVLSSSVMGSVGHCDPWASITFIRFQIGWFLRRGRSNLPSRNSDPYLIGDLACAANAFSKLKLDFWRTRKFDYAAAPFISNLKSGGSGHSLVDFTMTAMISIMFSGQIFGGASISRPSVCLSASSSSSCVGRGGEGCPSAPPPSCFSVLLDGALNLINLS